jgi:hypothetical protein
LGSMRSVTTISQTQCCCVYILCAGCTIRLSYSAVFLPYLTIARWHQGLNSTDPYLLSKWERLWVPISLSTFSSMVLMTLLSHEREVCTLQMDVRNKRIVNLRPRVKPAVKLDMAIFHWMLQYFQVTKLIAGLEPELYGYWTWQAGDNTWKMEQRYTRADTPL